MCSRASRRWCIVGLAFILGHQVLGCQALGRRAGDSLAVRQAKNGTLPLGVPRLRTLVARPLRLAFCPVLKVAHREFTELLLALSNLPPDSLNDAITEAALFTLPPGLLPRHDELPLTGWSFAFFTRDPLARLVSGFIQMEHIQHALDGDEHAWSEMVATAEGKQQLIAAFEQFTARGVLDNPHVMPQVEQLESCERMTGFHWRSAFQGKLTDSLVDNRNQVMAMLNKYSVSNASGLLDRYFPVSEVGHTHQRRVQYEVAEFYRDPAVLRAALRLCAVDYEKLQWPLPVFVTQAAVDR